MSGQFPSRDGRPAKHPVRNAYNAAEPSPFLRFNERDAASVAATTVAAQPALVFASALEGLAGTMSGQFASSVPTFSMAFMLTWLLQTTAVALFKIVACLLRNRGESLFRDIFAWLWLIVFQTGWEAFKDFFFFWRRRPRRRRRPFAPVFPDPRPAPGRQRRRPVRDALRRRRDYR